MEEEKNGTLSSGLQGQGVADAEISALCKEELCKYESGLGIKE